MRDRDDAQGSAGTRGDRRFKVLNTTLIVAKWDVNIASLRYARTTDDDKRASVEEDIPRVEEFRAALGSCYAFEHTRSVRIRADNGDCANDSFPANDCGNHGIRADGSPSYNSSTCC